ncbi:uncharacterized protein containing a von Willebrand factor type A (vWA) domain [Hahella chejuensis KCTC 2396]|uniref:Uncharacterized protein containing a von Willebrand factor type A (VWA) domain n=1 Tax=Hahella chejuensis (strain KCTC 2396) TaxID=349521 RepID=Q2SLR5_HAHCH|nr:VIT and VWA domain-containing protein [Hahella chejuensis]ABC28409.1 uncharacterized protein containing a von Willebrand factor type A (vWA) domain [Hahella chejuensis KCTC 2396]
MLNGKAGLASLSACVLMLSLSNPDAAQAAGLLKPQGGSLPDLDLRSQDVNVTIEGEYAITTVDQVFYNPNAQPLEAIYSFPVPEKAAVSQFTYWINGAPVHGEVVAKKQAREIYEQEKSEGRNAGLTEQDAYKTFDISISQVLPQQETKIRLVYLQPVHMDTGIGRYVYPLEEGGVDEEKLAFWTANETVKERFTFNLDLRSGYPVEALRLPEHPQAQIARMDERRWTVSLQSNAQSMEAVQEGDANAPASSPSAYRLDKDIVVYWRQQQNLPGSVDLITYKEPGKDKGTFMLTVTPGDDLPAITEGRDWTLVLDRSGSMSGKFSTLLEGLRKGFAKFNRNDRVRVIMFNDNATEVTNGWVQATPENLQQVVGAVENAGPSGGTNLMSAIQSALTGLDADRTNAIWLVTDGEANVGETKQKAFIELLEKKDIRLFTFIMGNSANRPLLEAITKHSNGFAISVSNSDDIIGQLMLAASKVDHAALHGANLKISGIKTTDVFPKQIGSVYRGQQLVMFGHYYGSGQAKVELTGKVSGSPIRYQTQFEVKDGTLHPELERLWAFAQIEDLMDQQQDYGEDADRKQAVTDLAVEYGLVTDYTSMLVLDEGRFEHYGVNRRIGDRISREESAREIRAQQPGQSHRVDNQQPMYTKSRPSFGGGGGGGAIDGFMLALLGALAIAGRCFRLRKR